MNVRLTPSMREWVIKEFARKSTRALYRDKKPAISERTLHHFIKGEPVRIESGYAALDAIGVPKDVQSDLLDLL